MTLIFWGSTDALSVRRTSRIIGPIHRWFMPDVRDETISAIQGLIRKGGHMAEYGVLCLLFWRALVQPKRGGATAWSWQKASGAWGLALIYAASDEWHQSFVASREGALRDVGFDMVGATAALLLLWAVGARLKWWTPALTPTGSSPRVPVTQTPPVE